MEDMKRMAVVNADGRVVNIILWDGESHWVPPDSCTLRDATEDDSIWSPGQDETPTESAE